MRALRDGRATPALEEVQRIVLTFKERAAARGAAKTQIFGTEALRRAADAGAQLAGIELLSPEDEAHCSFVAAVRGLHQAVSGKRVASIDQGNGSLEIAYGAAGTPPELHDWRSLPLGSDKLVSVLEDCGMKLLPFRDWVDAQLVEAKLPGIAVEDIVIQGSVATKYAWVVVRKNLDERYDGDRVHGYRAQISAVKALISKIHKTPIDNWDHLSRAINPKDPPTDQVHRLVTGCIVFERVSKSMSLNSFLVSSHGTRHGLLWKVLDA